MCGGTVDLLLSLDVVWDGPLTEAQPPGLQQRILAVPGSHAPTQTEQRGPHGLGSYAERGPHLLDLVPRPAHPDRGSPDTLTALVVELEVLHLFPLRSLKREGISAACPGAELELAPMARAQRQACHQAPLCLRLGRLRRSSRRWAATADQGLRRRPPLCCRALGGHCEALDLQDALALGQHLPPAPGIVESPVAQALGPRPQARAVGQLEADAAQGRPGADMGDSLDVLPGALLQELLHGQQDGTHLLGRLVAGLDLLLSLKKAPRAQRDPRQGLACLHAHIGR
mmetsp:Transcript_5374/g.16610  ORF Transcript_5374/g.16610 Transcript_5374/m.16610 type:complete len:285 (-) Transcript_5374:1351-2205(-)